MKLQHKAWILVLATVWMAALGAMFGARWVVGDSFTKLEQARAATEGERARRLLAQQMQGLAATLRDYAHWSDTVAFVEGSNATFMADNFKVDDNLANLRISEVLVVDKTGQTKGAVFVDESGSLSEFAPDRGAEYKALAMAVLADPDKAAVAQTYQVQAGRLDLVVASVIRDPADTSGTAHGAMVMVRHLDEAELLRFSEVLMMPVRLSMDVHEHEGQVTRVLPLDDLHDELHVVLLNRQGVPTAELVATLDRKLQAVGRILSWEGMSLAVLAGLISSALLVVLLDRLLLRRLQRLHGQLQGVIEQGPTSVRAIRVEGRDELTQLAEGINRLLTRVRQDSDAQREAHDRQEALQSQLVQSQKTEALGRLTGGIAHDFNNSLAAITGWVRLAIEDLDHSHPSHEALEQVLKSTRYADGLMRQLLAFGRQSSPKLRRLHWILLIEETRQMVSSGLTRNCELVMDCRTDDDEVDADPTQLQQVLVNLLINAADAMNGAGRIDMVLERMALPLESGAELRPGTAELAAGDYLVLHVRDHGPGIPPDVLDRVLEPFFTTKAKGRGTGLGLSVAHGIMARHHGSIGIRSELGQGATFSLYLPVSHRAPDVLPITGPAGLADQGRRILFVDDDQLVRHAWSALLARQGWEVTRSRDGEEAWHIFSQMGNQWDVVLTDLTMPRLDGLGLAERIWATQAPPPVVLMSGNVSGEDVARLLKSGFAAVLHKPVDASELESVLKDILESKKQMGPEGA